MSSPVIKSRFITVEGQIRFHDLDGGIEVFTCRACTETRGFTVIAENNDRVVTLHCPNRHRWAVDLGPDDIRQLLEQMTSSSTVQALEPSGPAPLTGGGG